MLVGCGKDVDFQEWGGDGGGERVHVGEGNTENIRGGGDRVQNRIEVEKRNN